MINELNSTKDEGAEPAAMSVGIEPQAAPEETLAAASEPFCPCDGLNKIGLHRLIDSGTIRRYCLENTSP